MKPALIAAAASLAAALLPAHARAAGPTMSVVDVPLAGERSPAAAATPRAFDVVGLHWQGSGTVEFRTRRVAGGWSAWHRAAPEAEDIPDPGTAEVRRAQGWRLGNPWWVGASDRIQYRPRGSVRRLRAFLVRSPVEAVPYRRLTIAGTPQIVPRADWGADESIRRAPPRFADAVRFAIVHHTAGSNDYTRAQAPAVVRAIELYHVKANGWNDIGYNFLVDRFGTVYEGRYGGVDRNVIGAHALGFNTGSTGVALLGTFTDAAPPKAAQDALARLLAWRLDIAHVDPLSTLTVVSGGSERYPEGIPVVLHAVSGHRDTGLTECPGTALYALLGAIAANAQSIGLPKIYAPAVTGKVGGAVRFQARLSGSAAWSVTVTDAAGVETARGQGTGTAVDWTWDASLAAGSYRWQIAVQGATPATGTVGGTAAGPPPPAALAITGAAADPQTVSPNGDGAADSSTIAFTLTVAASVTATVLDGTGAAVQTLLTATELPAGPHAIAFSADGLADGSYTVRLDATAGAATASASVPVTVERTLGPATVSPAVFSPNGDGRDDTLAIGFTLFAPATVRVRILGGTSWIASVFAGDLPAGSQSVTWDGSKRVGRLLDGGYTAEVDATTPAGTSTTTVAFASDTHAPAVRVVGASPLRLQVSEAATLRVSVNGHVLSVTAARAGIVSVPWPGTARIVSVVARDGAGNVSRPLRVRFPARTAGHRPAAQ